MEFSNLPKQVQLIAAECLAANISIKSGLVPAEKTEPAKVQARQIRDAFIELYTERDAQDEDAPRPGFSTESQVS